MRCAGAGDHQNVAWWADLLPMSSEEFTHQSFDPIANHRHAYLAAGRYTDAGYATAYGHGDDDEAASGAAPTSPLHADEFGALADTP